MCGCVNGFIVMNIDFLLLEILRLVFLEEMSNLILVIIGNWKLRVRGVFGY